jgi:hypothetical protein
LPDAVLAAIKDDILDMYLKMTTQNANFDQWWSVIKKHLRNKFMPEKSAYNRAVVILRNIAQLKME